MSTGNNRDNGSPRKPEAWAFFRQWLRDPRGIAAVSPSGRQLSRRMLEPLGPEVQRVVELGAGTGVFTQALLDRGIAAADLLVVELNQNLYQHLQQRFPEVNVVHGNATALGQLADSVGFLDHGPVDALVSGLGLLNMNRDIQRAILAAAFEVLAPDAPFVQFTYGPMAPVAREVLNELDLRVERTGFAIWNVPPASVFVFRRRRSQSVPAVRVARL